MVRIYLHQFQKTLTFVSNRTSSFMARQTLGNSGTESQTRLLLAWFGTSFSFF